MDQLLGCIKCCGIDEAGRGPVFGPMVISMVCGDVNKIAATGARDSKDMSQSSREIAYDKILKTAELVKFEIISSREINRLMDSMTLNEIEGKYVLKLLEYAEYPVIVDSFDVNADRCSGTLSQKSGKDVICRHKADRDYPNVSAASVIAKVIREREMDKIRLRYPGIGSGYPSDPYTIEYLRYALENKIDLKDIVRTKWKTFTNALNDTMQKRL
ncbi:MAG: ribonuclease HII [Candidatus Thermoplasmatota archaeon]|nr:ribonuclease HII [Candidatus Thermoplasmatota archaeon]